MHESKEVSTNPPVPFRHLFFGPIQVALDLGVLFCAIGLSYLLRFDFALPSDHFHMFLLQFPMVVLIQFVALTMTGARATIWRYTDLAHIRPFVHAALGSSLLFLILRVSLPSHYADWRVSVSIIMMDTVLGFGGVYAMRLLRHAAYDYQQKRRQFKKSIGNGHHKRAVLLLGAGRAGLLAAKEIEARGDTDLAIKGFIDDDRMKLGRTVVLGHKVLGTTQELHRLVRDLKIDHVVITIANAPRHHIHRIVRLCEEIPVRVRIIPQLHEIIDGRVEISRIRDVQIEDLLGREPVELDSEAIQNELTGKTVMVTGAGGSIGSELARQVKRFAPAKLLLVERAEFALFDIDHELRTYDSTVSLVPLVADVGDESRMRSIFNHYRPQVVIHAAAHKHVPLMESHGTEAVKNNVLNTRFLAELAGEFQTEVFVLVSTDKAVRPTSVMGATKRAAELMIQDLNRVHKTRYVAVRFGNVIGSAGSVIPIFSEQIRHGGPITITDKRMKRYFMTIPEAAQLVLQASVIGRGGEVFILHMGEPVKILDLAETLITLSGLKPYEDIEIVETGMRSGEKLYEELTFESEETIATSHRKIFINKLATPEPETVRIALTVLARLVRERNEDELRRFLGDLLPEAHLAPPASQNTRKRIPLALVGNAGA